MKNVISLVVLVMVVVSVCGCNAVDGILQDTAGMANAARQITTPMADKAQARDASYSGARLSRYHAEQAGRFASFNNKEQ